MLVPYCLAVRSRPKMARQMVRRYQPIDPADLRLIEAGEKEMVKWQVGAHNYRLVCNPINYSYLHIINHSEIVVINQLSQVYGRYIYTHYGL